MTRDNLVQQVVYVCVCCRVFVRVCGVLKTVRVCLQPAAGVRMAGNARRKWSGVSGGPAGLSLKSVALYPVECSHLHMRVHCRLLEFVSLRLCAALSARGECILYFHCITTAYGCALS